MTVCGAPNCNKQSIITGFKSIAETTCGDPQCIGVRKNAEYPNPDAESIKQLNETPNAFPTKQTFNSEKFTALLHGVVDGINSYCVLVGVRTSLNGYQSVTRSLQPQSYQVSSSTAPLLPSKTSLVAKILACCLSRKIYHYKIVSF